MNTSDIRADTKALLKARKLSVKGLSTLSRVDYGSLWRFLNRDANLNTDSLSKLWPVLYGDQRPVPVLEPQAARLTGPTAEAGS